MREPVEPKSEGGLVFTPVGRLHGAPVTGVLPVGPNVTTPAAITITGADGFRAFTLLLNAAWERGQDLTITGGPVRFISGKPLHIEAEALDIRQADA